MHCLFLGTECSNILLLLLLLEVNCYPTVVVCARGDANFEAGPAVTIHSMLPLLSADRVRGKVGAISADD